MPYGFSESVMEAADNLFSPEGRTMKPEDYIGKQVSVRPNDEFCPEGMHIVVGANVDTLYLDDAKYPWLISPKYVTVI